jgi:hypothetical protein
MRNIFLTSITTSIVNGLDEVLLIRFNVLSQQITREPSVQKKGLTQGRANKSTGAVQKL